VEHHHAVLDAWHAVWDLREVTFAQLFAGSAPVLAPLVPEVAVVGGDDLQVVDTYGLPEGLLIALLAERRRADPLGALEAGPRQVVFGEEEVLYAGLAVDSAPAAQARQADGLDRARVGDVYDVERCTGYLRQADGAVCRLGLQLRWARQRMVLRSGVACGQ